MDVDLLLDGKPFHVKLEEVDGRWEAEVDGERFPVSQNAAGRGVVVRAGNQGFVIQDHDTHHVVVDGRELPMRLQELHGVAGVAEGAGAGGAIKPPMTGRLDDVRVTEGQSVSRGDVLFVLEAMKMRNEVRSPVDGVVESVHAEAGANVDPQTTVVTLSVGA